MRIFKETWIIEDSSSAPSVETVGETRWIRLRFLLLEIFRLKLKKELQTTVKLLVEKINRVTKYIKDMATSYVNLNGCNLGGFFF